MEIKVELIKELRDKTGASIVDCKKALIDSQGNIENAIEILKRKGIEQAREKSDRTTKEGIIGSYIHSNNKIGVLVEVRCESDFVARTDEFKELVKDISMQICAMNPLYVSKEDVPQEVINKEKEYYKTTMKLENKPPEIIEKIIAGKLEKFYIETCLLEQPFIKNEKIRIKDLINEKISKFGENIVIKRFIRFEIS
jgi:elongation factor Ts